MKRLLLCAVVVGGVLLPAGSHGQGEEKVIRSRGIEGYLEDASGFAVQHAQVDVVRCRVGTTAARDEDVLRSGETDEEGRFNIADVSGGQTRCVRIHKKGFSPLMVKVKLTMFASNMKLRLERQR